MQRSLIVAWAPAGRRHVRPTSRAVTRASIGLRACASRFSTRKKTCEIEEQKIASGLTTDKQRRSRSSRGLKENTKRVTALAPVTVASMASHCVDLVAAGQPSPRSTADYGDGRSTARSRRPPRVGPLQYPLLQAEQKTRGFRVHLLRHVRRDVRRRGRRAAAVGRGRRQAPLRRAAQGQAAAALHLVFENRELKDEEASAWNPHAVKQLFEDGAVG